MAEAAAAVIGELGEALEAVEGVEDHPAGFGGGVVLADAGRASPRAARGDDALVDEDDVAHAPPGTAALVLAAASAVGGMGWTLAMAALIELAVGLAVAAAIVRKGGVLDGDGMGAAIEISIVAGLVATAAVTV